jgi:hypothetical protein
MEKSNVATEIESKFFCCWLVTGQMKMCNMFFHHHQEIPEYQHIEI